LSQTRFIGCTCNGTAPLSAGALPSRVGGLELSSDTESSELCRRDIQRFIAALDGDQQLLVGCTQEAPLFDEIAASRTVVAPVRFVNLRERASWGVQGESAGPKIAALVALAASAVVDPVPAVPFVSSGRTLIIGEGSEALEWAERLSGQLSVSVLMTASGNAILSGEHRYPVFSGSEVTLTGWLGAFQANWKQSNPIDLDSCVRCGACIAACPEQAIDESLQVNLDVCRDHRACVTACATVGAIDFSRSDVSRSDQFDLIFDLRDESAFTQSDRPLGYFHPGADLSSRINLALELVQTVGEFEKPRYFNYNQKLCAHRRNQIDGCTKCIDICSTSAISSNGDLIRVEPHLCLGCGGCSSVCPSGALSYAVPTPSELGRRLRLGLAAYSAAGGSDALILFHDAGSGRRLLDEVGRGRFSSTGPAAKAPGVRGLPARVIPVEVNHIASIGMDLCLASLAFGASQVAVLTARETPKGYLDGLREQYGIAQQLMHSLAYSGDHFPILRPTNAAELEALLFSLVPAQAVESAAGFAVADEKRRTIENSIDHLAQQSRKAARSVPEQIALAAGAPFGVVRVDSQACTLCKACIGACPEAALLDSPEHPQLRFIERNCVQCGLCVKTCPENALTLEPRYLLGEAARAPVVLNEAQPFHCVSCGEPFGTERMVQSMLSRLGTHSMFAGRGLKRLQMCADCRVSDMVTNKDEMTIFDVSGRG
jgi:ferredoxin